MQCEIFAKVSSSTLILTANRRLASLCQQQYDQHQIKNNHNVWLTLNVLPLHSWLTQLWQTHPLGAQVLLNASQEQVIWERIIKNQTPDQTPIQIQTTAKLAQQAWQIMNQWRLSINDLPDNNTREVTLFKEWAQAFIDYCEQHQCQSSARINAIICNAISNGEIDCPKTICLIGYDEITPELEHLTSVLREHCDVSFIHDTKINAEIKRIQTHDADAEIKLMAQWAQQQLTQNPNANIGCIVPTLEQLRPYILRTFTGLFNVETLLPGIDNDKRWFNISAALTLDQYEIIASALAALECAQDHCSIDSFSNIVLSPYFHCHDEDRPTGALLDQALRDNDCVNVTLSQLSTYIEPLQSRYAHNTWLTRFRELNQFSLNNALLPSQWADTFLKILHALGWPGQRGVNSLEYQLIQRWYQLLSEFSSLDTHAGTLYFNQALKQLNDMTQSTPFQPEGSDAPIQILGLLESAGYQFDALWVMGLDDETWPPAAKPNPFLPRELQRELNMPHASAQRELNYSKTLLDRLVHSAPSVMLSASEFNGDQCLRESPLIQEYPKTTADDLQLTPTASFAQQQMEHSILESITNDFGPPLTTDNAQGGSWILQAQAACPFQAFAQFRLNASTINAPTLGIHPVDRGAWIHEALECIWHELKSQKNLRAQTESKLKILVSKHVDRALKHSQNVTLSANEQFFQAIERARLITIILQWLNTEKERPDFVVAAAELQQKITIPVLNAEINALHINTRIDRIDTLSDNTNMIIDYKTGIAMTHEWFNERLQAPQLPLYCSFSKQRISGLCYAQLKTGKMQFEGVIHQDTDENIQFKGLMPADYITIGEDIMHWDMLIDYWRTQISQLASEFSQGYAAVSPFNGAQTCARCHYASLCRINQ